MDANFENRLREGFRRAYEDKNVASTGTTQSAGCIPVSNATFDWTNKEVHFKQDETWTKISFSDLSKLANDIKTVQVEHYECGGLRFFNKEYNDLT